MGYVTVQTNDRTQVYTKEFYNKVGESELIRIAFEHYHVQEQYEDVVSSFVKKDISFSGIQIGELINV